MHEPRHKALILCVGETIGLCRPKASVESLATGGTPLGSQSMWGVARLRWTQTQDLPAPERKTCVIVEEHSAEVHQSGEESA